MHLALDTSRDFLEVALLADGADPASVRLERREGRESHNERLNGAVRALLLESGTPAAAVKSVSVVAGPGSFTGLRIGLSWAKAFAWARGVPLYAEHLLVWTARAVGAARSVTVLPARRGAVFAAFHAEEGRLLRDGEYEEGVFEAMLRDPGPLGGAFRPGDPLIGPWSRATGAFASYPGPVPSVAAALVAAAPARVAASEPGADPKTVAPIYLRPSEAEVRLASGALRPRGGPAGA